MKKSLILLLTILLIIFSGCGKKDIAAETSEASLPGLPGAGEVSEDISSEDGDEDEEPASDDTAETEVEISDVETVEDTSAETEPEADPVVSMRERLETIRNNRNDRDVDFTPTIGEFCVMDEDGLDTVDNPDGELYGFWDDMTGGCSVWCAVLDYNVHVEASSSLESQGGHTYDAENVISRDRNVGWVEGVSGDGIGEKISITKSYDVECASIVPDDECIFYYELCIVNGLARTDKVWKANGRVKSLKFYFNGEYMGTIELEDTMKPQYISLSGLNLTAHNNEESTFTFEIADIYPGDKYDDTAITGIEIGFDTPNH